MKKLQVIAVLLLVLGFMLASEAGAISRTAKRFTVVDFKVGMGNPIGEYNRIGGGELEILFENSSGRLVDLDADEVYDNSWYFGLNYGNLINGKLYYDIGFQYVKIQHEDTFFVDALTAYAYPDIYGSMKIALYDLNTNFNYYFSDPFKTSVAPYAGLSLQAGILSTKLAEFESENKLVYGLGLNFGADIKIWESPDDNSVVAFSSSNQLGLATSDSRPRYLQIGGAIKYFFRY